MAASVSDLSGLGLLTWVYPPGLVDRVVAACDRAERRQRLLPARLVVYFVLALALFSPAPYLE
ncbi:transposase domain-containing protein, partial [Streptomyces mirabilis]|uniref:transposase domain-containing protein n=1 Tax=Streptomyces mirabilis TaxID=68239 RepID=UPI00331876B1